MAGGPELALFQLWGGANRWQIWATRQRCQRGDVVSARNYPRSAQKRGGTWGTQRSNEKGPLSGKSSSYPTFANGWQIWATSGVNRADVVSAKKLPQVSPKEGRDLGHPANMGHPPPPVQGRLARPPAQRMANMGHPPSKYGPPAAVPTLGWCPVAVKRERPLVGKELFISHICQPMANMGHPPAVSTGEMWYPQRNYPRSAQKRGGTWGTQQIWATSRNFETSKL